MTAIASARVPSSAFVDDGDATLIKSTRVAVCAVCRNTVTASILLPDDRAVCQGCACIALNNMIADAEACR